MEVVLGLKKKKAFFYALYLAANRIESQFFQTQLLHLSAEICVLAKDIRRGFTKLDIRMKISLYYPSERGARQFRRAKINSSLYIPPKLHSVLTISIRSRQGNRKTKPSLNSNASYPAKWLPQAALYRTVRLLRTV